MLEVSEKEDIVIGDNNHSKVFTSNQLLVMLMGIWQQSANLNKICHKISDRFREDGEQIQTRFYNNSNILSEDDSAQIQKWLKVVKVFSEQALNERKKFALIGLFLEIAVVIKPFSGLPDFVSDLAQMISVDFVTGRIKADMFKSVSACLAKFSLLDQHIHSELLNKFRDYLSNVSAEDCFDVFLDEAENLSAEISELFFDRAITSFSEKKGNGIISKAWKASKTFFGYKNKNQVQNLARLFSRCIADFNLDHLEGHELVLKATDLPAISNMMKFFPKLLDVSKLDTEIVKKGNQIIEEVDRFTIDLFKGRVTLQVCLMLKDQSRAERLISLHETLSDVRKSMQEFSNSDLKTLIRLRIEETDAYHRAAEDVEGFVTKFKRKESDEIDQIASQFKVDPSEVFIG
jgi:hypothetical protein